MPTTTRISPTSWRKSSHSNTNGGECIEFLPSAIGPIVVRDSKNPDGARLTFTHDAWEAFIKFAADQEL